MTCSRGISIVGRHGSNINYLHITRINKPSTCIPPYTSQFYSKNSQRVRDTMVPLVRLSASHQVRKYAIIVRNPPLKQCNVRCICGSIASYNMLRRFLLETGFSTLKAP